jgi:phosphate starvation-inducible PhoH-like protein
MRSQIELTNVLAAELAGSQDTVLRALEEHLECEVFLRGNLITFDGDEHETHVGEHVVRELAKLIERGHQLDAGTIAAVTGALDAHESPARVLEDVIWQHRGLRVAPKTVNQKRSSTRSARARSPSGWGRQAPGRRFWRWRWPPPRSRATR